jgi:hypothetical protein
MTEDIPQTKTEVNPQTKTDDIPQPKKSQPPGDTGDIKRTTDYKPIKTEPRMKTQGIYSGLDQYSDPIIDLNTTADGFLNNANKYLKATEVAYEDEYQKLAKNNKQSSIEWKKQYLEYLKKAINDKDAKRVLVGLLIANIARNTGMFNRFGKTFTDTADDYDGRVLINLVKQDFPNKIDLIKKYERDIADRTKGDREIMLMGLARELLKF